MMHKFPHLQEAHERTKSTLDKMRSLWHLKLPLEVHRPIRQNPVESEEVVPTGDQQLGSQASLLIQVRYVIEVTEQPFRHYHSGGGRGGEGRGGREGGRGDQSFNPHAHTFPYHIPLIRTYLQ